MSNPVLNAFFIGRALAEALSEQAEQATTEVLGQLGKFDAEQRENLRQFTEVVMAKAQQAEVVTPQPATGEDLQATIDNLRAEIAQARVALQQYRSS